jgi:hypothetical protein
VRAEAEVRAATEGDVLVRAARDVEPVRVGELRRVAIGGREHRHDRGVLRDHLATDLEVLARDADGEEDRPVEAQALVDRGREQLGLRAQALGLLGVRDQRTDPVPDQADGGLEARDEQARRVREQLARGEAIALLLRRDQVAEQVVPARAAARGDQLLEVAAQRAAAAARPRAA